MKRILVTLLLASAFCISALAQFDVESTVDWKSAVKKLDDSSYELVLSGQVADGWHTYPLDGGASATEIEWTFPEGVSAEGEPVEECSITDYKGERVIEGSYVIRQKLSVAEGASGKVGGVISWRSCCGDNCHTPEDWTFSESLGDSADKAVITASEPSSKTTATGMWALILEAILWGFAMLLTPCVFPMVPMTISFFMKGSATKSQGRFKAIMYGVFIVLLYTVPICLIIGITWLVGGNSVTADIFNWLATHWLPNILFFAVFMVFAASFFGAFEITLPSKWTNSADRNSDRKGLLGVFFIALTLVLVSFSCTGPIVGTVLIKSTSGEFWTPMVTMLAFSLAFALPFTVLALFPSLLKNLPKSGGWLNSVKVVLGFIEVALGFKFLSTADQTYGWHLLDREVYLAIWIVVFTLLGFYLLGKLRFANDDVLDHISVKRLALAIAVFSFVVYMIPGMWGAPLKALSGYLPPIQTQDFVIGQYSAPAAVQTEVNSTGADKVKIAQGLWAYESIEDGLAASQQSGKPVFVDITGLGCVNCREMEARVWSDPRVRAILAEKYEIVSLNTDDKTRLPEDKWITTESGKVLKDVGRVNSYVVRERFDVNAQPNYVLLSSDGTLLAPVRGYNLDVDAYISFLNSGLK